MSHSRLDSAERSLTAFAAFLSGFGTFTLLCQRLANKPPLQYRQDKYELRFCHLLNVVLD